MNRYLLSIDQGTTGSTALVMGMDGRTHGRESQQAPQHFPEPAWVEHDPAEIQASVIKAVRAALRAVGIRGSERRAIGITNQRAATLLWDKVSGRPIDPWPCELFRVPRAVLSRIVPSTGRVARTRTGLERVRSAHGLLAKVAWQIGEQVVSALEGSCFVAGAAVQWLRDGLGWSRSSSEIEARARSVASSDGVVFVAALSDQGAPHWDPDARGLSCGLTRGSSTGPIARATLESIAFQVADLVSALREDLSLQRRTADVLAEPAASAGRSGDRGTEESAEGGIGIRRIRVDGGAAQNNLLMQFQSDVSDVGIERPLDVESTARGAARLAGVGVGVFRSVKEAAQPVKHPERFQPQMARSERQKRLSQGRAAGRRARSELDLSVPVAASTAGAEEGRHGH